MKEPKYIELQTLVIKILKARSFSDKAEALTDIGNYILGLDEDASIGALVMVIETHIRVQEKRLNKDAFQLHLMELLQYITDFKESRQREKVLDLSNHSTKEDECLDLAKNISAVMLNEHTPKGIYEALADELSLIDVADYYTPENIAKIICEGGEK